MMIMIMIYNDHCGHDNNLDSNTHRNNDAIIICHGRLNTADGDSSAEACRLKLTVRRTMPYLWSYRLDWSKAYRSDHAFGVESFRQGAVAWRNDGHDIRWCFRSKSSMDGGYYVPPTVLSNLLGSQYGFSCPMQPGLWRKVDSVDSIGVDLDHDEPFCDAASLKDEAL